MATTVIERIEAEMGQLSLSDQLRLMERLARQIREHGLPGSPTPEDRLATMADDPDIQRELALIEAEFAGTEADGLGGSR